MDPATGLGIALGMAAMIVAFVMDGGHLNALWTPSSFILIFFGTLGMTMASFPMKRFARLPAAVARAFFPRSQDPAAVVDVLARLAEKARREGLLALQDDVEQLEHPLLRRGLTMVVDGTDPQQLRENLESQVKLEQHRQEELAAILEQAGGYSPTVGIIGTVMGLVHVLSNLSEVEKLGPLIAVAFLATFYGIFFANLIWLPMANKLKVLARHEAELGHLIIEGLASLQAGENPRWLREKLSIFVEAPGKAAGERDQPSAAAVPVREAGD